MSELSPLPPVESHPESLSEEEYVLLRGHHRTDGSYKSDKQLRSEYVQLTDEVIHRITDGIEVTDPVTGEKDRQQPDAVVWLDKSARPVAWLTKELWPLLAGDEEGNAPDMPQFFFVSIDREQWVNTIDPTGTGYLNIDRVDKSIIRSLRSIFISPDKKRDGLTEELDETPALLDGKTVLVVDEVQATGRTLNIAQKFLAKAFPTAKVAGMHWMGGIVQKDDAVGNADLPVWYRESVETGRGVSNRDERFSQSSKSLTQKLGGWFLSTALREPDPTSKQLRHELKQLARDVENHEVLYVPSLKRDMDDFDERAQRINGMTFDEFLEAKKELSKPAQPQL